MPLRVVCLSTYRTAGAWRPLDHDAHKFIDAIKDRPLNGYAEVPVRGQWRRFDNGNRQAVVGWFAELVADHLRANPVNRGACFVPVPGSKVGIDFEGEPRTAQLARAISAELDDGSIVRDALRWQHAMPSAHEEGGTRDPRVLFERLVLTSDVSGARVILVDDVMTSGGHLKACAAKLGDRGAMVLMAVVAGRAAEGKIDHPFSLRIEDIDDYQPG